MQGSVARVAVSAATYWIDKPYEYLIPEQLTDRAAAGMRVLVPFSAGNRKCEGIILAVSETASYEKLKSVISLLDEKPVLSPWQISLALFMRERFFCTVYDAVRAILPAGLWFNAEGKRRVADKTEKIARLCVTAEEAEEIADSSRLRSDQQKRLLRELAAYSEMPLKELLLFAGTTKAPFQTLEKAGYVEVYEREVFRLPTFTQNETAELPVLNDEQQRVYESISRIEELNTPQVALLHGVTGSGKTSVYIHLIKKALDAGKTAILLVPEIALTPQMLRTFSSYFGGDIAVLHSSLSAGERYDEWKRLKTGKAHLAIGTRSAVFAPVDNPGIIIIDEEQEDTYRSENTPRYNALDVAKYRCVKAGCLLLLGSATPSVGTRYSAAIGKYSYFQLKSRYNAMKLPEVSVVDMKKELKAGNDSCISSFLRDELQANIERGEQSILFLNRRGAHKLVTCGECGYTYKCPNCSVSLTYHSANERLLCHYCGYTQSVGKCCPECEGILRYVGAGTQLVEEEIHNLFPEIDVIRADADALSSQITHEQIFEKFRNENIPVMVGTQMVTKGLNFENVTLVGVLSADQMLYSGNYRAAEKAFSMITQVVGRSGRGTKPGRAVIQTFTPRNEVIIQAADQDYDAFYDEEIAIREALNAPPFTEIISLTISGKSESETLMAGRFVKKRIEHLLENVKNISVLGPAPLNVVKVNNRFRYRVLIKCNADGTVRRAVSDMIIECSTNKNFRNLSFYADYDPED